MVARVVNRPRRLVLDTNAVLDWLVFADPCLEGLSAAMRAGEVEVLGHPLVLDELRRVLAYPLLNLDTVRQAQVLADYHALLTQAELPAEFGSDHYMLPEGFPRCRDPDDQVFLALAYHAQAVLVSRDKVVLKLAKRVRRFGVQIISPQQFMEWLAAG
jgi:putative PIN family toxin of toxin-antitoxin system